MSTERIYPGYSQPDIDLMPAIANRITPKWVKCSCADCGREVMIGPTQAADVKQHGGKVLCTFCLVRVAGGCTIQLEIRSLGDRLGDPPTATSP